jgi:hypothetical protein
VFPTVGDRVVAENECIEARRHAERRYERFERADSAGGAVSRVGSRNGVYSP